MPGHTAGLSCASCGRAGTPDSLAQGWSLSRPPRPTGQTAARTEEQERTTALCPDCARREVRLLEARLDP